MKKALASLVALVAVLAGLLLTAGTASATTGTTDPSFDCANMLGVGQVCNNVSNVKVVVTYHGFFSGSSLARVEDVLNELAVTGIDGDVNLIKGDILNLYYNEFNIPILAGNVVVTGWPSCGC
jgi:hypothetical protein